MINEAAGILWEGIAASASAHSLSTSASHVAFHGMAVKLEVEKAREQVLNLE